MRKPVALTAALILTLAVLIFVGIRWLEPAMIYHPVRAIQATPADAGMAFRDVTFATSDGETLRGWWIPAPPTDGTTDKAAQAEGGGSGPVLLFLHGNAGNREHRLHNLQGLNNAGISVFIFDYRGFGGSTGKPSEEGLLLDGEAAFDWLRNEVGDRPIVLFGRSLGGGVAANLALRRPVAGLILESTFTNVPEMARRVLPLPGIGLLVRTRFDALSAVRELTLPLMIIHGEADELVPFAMGKALFEAARSTDRSFHSVPGGRHNDTYVAAGDSYYPWFTSFLERLGP